MAVYLANKIKCDLFNLNTSFEIFLQEIKDSSSEEEKLALEKELSGREKEITKKNLWLKTLIKDFSIQRCSFCETWLHVDLEETISYDEEVFCSHYCKEAKEKHWDI